MFRGSKVFPRHIDVLCEGGDRADRPILPARSTPLDIWGFDRDTLERSFIIKKWLTNWFVDCIL